MKGSQEEKCRCITPKPWDSENDVKIKNLEDKGKEMDDKPSLSEQPKEEKGRSDVRELTRQKYHSIDENPQQKEKMLANRYFKIGIEEGLSQLQRSC
jgi:hypothetical protein